MSKNAGSCAADSIVRKVQNMEVVEQIIREIYEGNPSSTWAGSDLREVQADLGYGTIYSVIRETLQDVCKSHRKLINCSAVSYAKNISNYYKVNMGGNADDSDLKFYETTAHLIYYHFINIASANRQVCQLWEGIKGNMSGFKTNGDYTIRTPELKLSILNLLTLKELIPFSDTLNLAKFREILERLLASDSTLQKQHLQQLLEVYRQSDSTEDSLKFQTTKPQIATLLDSESDEDCLWLKKAKENPIAKKLAQRLGGKFCKDEDKKISISDKVVEDLAKGILSQKLFGVGLGSESPMTAKRASQLLKSFEDKLSMDEDEPDKLQANETGKRKKKRKKNKRKKEKAEESQQDQKQSKIAEEQIDLICYQETIKFLREMKIDDSKRLNCTIENRRLEEWKKNLHT